MSIQTRGKLSPRITAAAKHLMGYEINTKEFRLMPYIVDVMMNAQKLDPQKINGEEREILQKWRDSGYIEGGAGGLQITEEFWNICCEIVRLGYVDLGEID